MSDNVELIDVDKIDEFLAQAEETEARLSLALARVEELEAFVKQFYSTCCDDSFRHQGLLLYAERVLGIHQKPPSRKRPIKRAALNEEGSEKG